MKVNKAKLNLIIDIIMFIVMMGVAGIGFLIKFVLVPGFKRNDLYGRDVELFFCKLDRHQWGTIHLIISFILLFLLLLHLVFHWKQIVCIFKKMIKTRFLRIALTTVFIAISILLSIIPLFINPKIEEGSSHKHSYLGGNSNERFFNPKLDKQIKEYSATIITDTIPVVAENILKQHEHESTIEVFGYMSLNEVATKYNVPASELANLIHVPVGNINEKLGRLRKKHNFHLSDIRNYIEKNNE